jgi:hypothetical protein
MTLLAILLAAAPLGPCADRSKCGFRGTDSFAKSAISDFDLKTGDDYAIEVERLDHEFLVRARDLKKPVSMYGLARVPVQDLPKPDQHRRAIQIALREGIARAMADLSEVLAGQRKLHLSLKVTGLSPSARQFASETFFPCLKQHFDALGAVTEPHEVAGFLEDEIQYAPAKDEPRDPLEWQAQRLKNVCPAPPGLHATASADSVNRGVVLSFTR